MPDIMTSNHILHCKSNTFDTNNGERSKKRADTDVDHHISHTMPGSDDKDEEEWYKDNNNGVDDKY